MKVGCIYQADIPTMFDTMRRETKHQLQDGHFLFGSLLGPEKSSKPGLDKEISELCPGL